MITMYSTNCPKCKVLEKKLRAKHIDFTVCDNTSVMIQRSITQVPMLEVNGELMDFRQSVEWINKQ